MSKPESSRKTPCAGIVVTYPMEATYSRASDRCNLSMCELSSSQAKVIRECDFAYFAAIMAPFAKEHKFRTICDWGNWVFPYDDLFDNGTMRNDPNQATVAMNMLMASFDKGFERELEPALHPGMESIGKLVGFHARIWHSFESNASPGM